MRLDELAAGLKKEVRGRVKISESLSRHTTWRIGGPADLFFIPADRSDLSAGLQFGAKYQLPVTIIGGGSNLLVRDEGIRGMVIRMTDLRNIQFTDEFLKAGGGVRLPYLAREIVRRGLTGLEFAAGIPGTVGGAVIMNAGAHGGSMHDVVENVVAMDYQGNILDLSKKDLEFSYRNSRLKGSNLIVIEVHLKLKSGDAAESQTIIKRNLEFRNLKQPWEYPNGGSVFKNPPGDSAGRMIDSVGAKGWQVGNAQVSEKHANFIINLGGATCSEVLALMEKINHAVYGKFGVLLEPEILVLGG
ncbi:MAG: UDP-N-acetylmuramate dehydrogenase [Peptococcaceae bacterium]